MRKTILWGIVGLLVCVAGALSGAYIYTVRAQARAEAANQQAYRTLVESVDNFHADIKMVSPTATSMREQLRRIKDTVAKDRVQIEKIATQANTSKGADAALLRDAVSKVQKYLDGYTSLASMEINSDTLDARADEMITACHDYAQVSHTVVTPDRGDCKQLMSQCKEVVQNYLTQQTAATKQAKIDKEATQYWANVNYTPYRDAIRSIVARYSSGRTVVAGIMRKYDRGQLTESDRAQWQMEVQRRRTLLTDLDENYAMIPPGSIYEKHHILLHQMIEEGVEAMEQFESDESSYTRANLTAVSSRNTAVMNRLKSFYGIR